MVESAHGSSSWSTSSEVSTHSRSVVPTHTPALKFKITGCGAVQAFFNQTADDWLKVHASSWLDRWWVANQAHFAGKPGGFAAALGSQYLANPDWTCRTEGSSSNCDFNPCTAAGLNALGPADMQSAYLVLESVNRLHTYFTGLGQALQVSAIGAALAKDDWANIFWNAHHDMDMSGLRNLLTVATTLVGIAAALMGPVGIVAGTVAAVGSTLFGAGVGFANIIVKDSVNDNFGRAADIGSRLSGIFMQSLEEMITGNNLLMSGQSFGKAGDIRAFLSGGAFADYPGMDQVALIDIMSTKLMATAINALWRQQKVYIMGGGPCDDSGGIGKGPQGYKVCRDGKAWYLFFWEELGHIALDMHQWGWISPPPGIDRFGEGDYKGLRVEDVINSSLDSWLIAGYNYTEKTANDQTLEALRQGIKKPSSLASPAWQGTFTIPVCDVSSAAKANIRDASDILMEFNGRESRPKWCGPVCSNNQAVTDAFIRAAQMENFKSPSEPCYQLPMRWSPSRPRP